jgi:hypothetical protein
MGDPPPVRGIPQGPPRGIPPGGLAWLAVLPGVQVWPTPVDKDRGSVPLPPPPRPATLPFSGVPLPPPAPIPAMREAVVATGQSHLMAPVAHAERVGQRRTCVAFFTDGPTIDHHNQTRIYDNCGVFGVSPKQIFGIQSQ